MEILDIVDENDNLTGEVEDRETIHEKGIWHRHVGIWIMNEKGELLFQKRSKNKKTDANKWSRTGGHVDSKEDVYTAIIRETEEEIGVKLSEDKLELMKISKIEKYDDKTKRYVRNFNYIFFTLVNYKIEEYIIRKEELSEIKYIKVEEIEELYEKKDKNYTFSNWNNDEFCKMITKLKEKRNEI